MSISASSKEFAHTQEPVRLRAPALRRWSANHPMAMFVVLAAGAFGVMTLAPVTTTAFASLGVTAHERAKPVDDAPFTSTSRAPKADRVTMSETDTACLGQAWGAEDTECLASIARNSGRTDTRTVRTIVNAEPNMFAPNVF